MTAEDIAKGIVYSDDFETLIDVPNQETIRISNLTKIIFGSSQSNYAFRKSTTTLRNFTFMDNPILTTIQSYAFYGCSSLQAIDLSQCSLLESINSYAFSGCSSVSSILFPFNGCLRILGSQSFTRTNVSSVRLPNTITSITSAFFSSKLNEVIFEERSQIDAILWGSFSYSNIYNFTIPDSVTSITAEGFQGTYMRYINVDRNNKNFVVSNNALYDVNMTRLIYYPRLCSDVLVLPETLLIIDDSSFLFSSIPSIELPKSLQKILGYAFECSIIKKITIPASVILIESNAFALSKLEEVYFEESSNLTSIPNSCFYNSPNLALVILPSSITEVGGAAFSKCSKDIKIQFSDDSPLKFDQQRSLIMSKNETIISCYLKISESTEVEIPPNATTIKSNCFNSQTHLTKITFAGNKMTTIEARAFMGLREVEIEIPSSVTTIGEYAFYQTSLTSVTLSSTLTLREYSFGYCTPLKQVEINKITTIPTHCFENCINLESFTIKEGLTSIQDYAFINCSKLKSFNSQLYHSSNINNIFYVPKTLTSIGEKAFEGTAFDEIIYQEGSSAKSIPNFAFYGSHFTKISLPESIKSLGKESFAYTSLKTFKVPRDTYSIDQECFSYCHNLETFTIPTGCALSDFGDFPFFSCSSLKEIICDSNNFVVSNEALFDTGLSKLIVYPAASLQYIFALPQTIRTISVGAFYGAKHLRSVQIPDDSLTIISRSAFENCKKLQIISLPASIQTIGQDAFKGCTKIQCGQIVTLSDLIRQNLISSAKFPERGLRPCYEISCFCNIPKLSRSFVFESIVMPLCFSF